MNPRVSNLVAGWLTLCGFCACVALAGAGLMILTPDLCNKCLVARTRISWGGGSLRILGGIVFVIAIPSACYLWEGILFFRRKSFSRLGQIVVLVNTVLWGLALCFVLMARPANISPGAAPVIQVITTTIRTFCVVLYLANLLALAWIWISRRSFGQKEAS